MTIELALCALLMLVALPVSKSIAAHYLAFALVNLAFLGVTYADSSLLVMTFAALAIVDTLLAIYGRPVLFVSAAASVALSFESIGDGDWLLNHSGYISIAVNALIIGSLIKELKAWMNGKLAH